MAVDLGHAEPEAGAETLVQVVWTQRALVELQAIETYIAQFNPLAAQRLALRIVQAADALDFHPDRGRPISGNRRELTTTPPYVIRYRRNGQVVSIIEIRHAAREPD